jgi:hypothetical protein
VAFREPAQEPQFADLKGILAQSRKNLDSATYRTISQIIDRLQQFKNVNDVRVAGKVDSGTAAATYASKTSSFITKDDESVGLPNSRELLAGSGIILDYSVPNRLTIKASSTGNHYDAPLSDGDTSAADLIFANGECIIVQVPV